MNIASQKKFQEVIKLKMSEKLPITRREFFKNSLIGIIGITSGLSFGKQVYDYYSKQNKKNILYNIYNILPNHVHLAGTTLKMINESTGKEELIKENIGCGIILRGRYITMAHITNINTTKQGDYLIIEDTRIIKMPPESKLEKKVRLYGYELKELVLNPKNDVAIYRLPQELRDKLQIQEFPCRPETKINLGEKVYIIGNPQLEGNNVRESRISDKDGFNSIKKTFDQKKNSFFGIDSALIPGDSGAPIVNEKYELIGLGAIQFDSDLGYVKKIGEFLKEKCMKDNEAKNVWNFNEDDEE